MTATMTSSPTMIRSPGRRVMMSTWIPPWKACRVTVVSCRAGGPWRRRPIGHRRGNALRLGGLRHRLLGEERGAHGRVRGLVDDLVATAVGDHERRPQVRAE